MVLVLVHDISRVQKVIGSISAICSLFAFMTYVLFKPLRSLRYVELVFYISVNDFIASVGVALGAVPNNSFGCYFQGYTSNANYLSSIMWTTVVTYQVYLVIFYGALIKNMKPFHVICWGIPFITASLVFSTNTYGNLDDESSWCFVSSVGRSPSWGVLFWELFAFYFWLWIAIVLNIIMLARIRWRISQSEEEAEASMTTTLRKLIVYPIMLMVCWTLDTVVNIYLLFHHHTEELLLDRVSIVLPMFQGMVFAIIFFSVNPIVRNYWYVAVLGSVGAGLRMTQAIIYRNALDVSVQRPSDLRRNHDFVENIFDRTRSMNSVNELDIQKEPDYLRQLEELRDTTAEDNESDNGSTAAAFAVGSNVRNSNSKQSSTSLPSSKNTGDGNDASTNTTGGRASWFSARESGMLRSLLGSTTSSLSGRDSTLPMVSLSTNNSVSGAPSLATAASDSEVAAAAAATLPTATAAPTSILKRPTGENDAQIASRRKDGTELAGGMSTVHNGLLQHRFGDDVLGRDL